MLWTLLVACLGSEAADPSPRFDGLDAARAHANVRLVPFARGLEAPTDLVFPPGVTDKLVVIEKGGVAKVVTLATGAVAPWFSTPVRTESEMGLLGIAFPSDWATTGRFYLHTNPKGGDGSRLAAWTASGLGAPAREERVLLEVAQPYANHDGGSIGVLGDGRLYWALGDGGARDDPHDAGQRLDTHLGKLLMIRPTPGEAAPYAIPSDNPFASTAGAKPEIWAYGLRNPWKVWPLADGRFVVGDVGQDRWEEIDVLSRGDNAGWRRREGRHCHDEGKCEGSFVEPIYEYGRDDGASVTGGVVAGRPAAIADRYVFGDFVSGRLWALSLTGGDVVALGRFELNPTAFARGPDGAVYVADFQRGAVFRIE